MPKSAAPCNNLSIKAKLSDKLAVASAYINCAALRHNANIAQAIAPKAKLIAVIKANAYGHGMLDTAKALSNIAYGFAVARVDEALTLRHNGFKQMIIVMSPALSDKALLCCADNQLTAVIHSQQNISTLPPHLDYWLKIDSGMHRLGLTINELNSFLEQTTTAPTLMTHFSSAEQDNAATIALQMQQFKQALTQSNLSLSLCNSAALLRHNNAANYQQWQTEQLDNYKVTDEYIRPGIMLYGADPLKTPNNVSQSLFATMTLAAPVLATRTVKKGETVGYNGKWQAPRDSLIATIGIGYGDGYPRHAPNGTPVILHGQRVPITGNVSMDTISVDITELVNKGIEVRAGDSAELWGENLAANEVAKLAGTISYELFTGISQRVARILI